MGLFMTANSSIDRGEEASFAGFPLVVALGQHRLGQGEHVGSCVDEHRGDLRMRSAGDRVHLVDPVVQTWCEAREQSRHVGYDAKSVL